MTTLSDLSELAQCPLPLDQYLEIEIQGARAAVVGLRMAHNPYVETCRMILPQDCEDREISAMTIWAWGYAHAREDSLIRERQR
jgi:hypothetical protein